MGHSEKMAQMNGHSSSPHKTAHHHAIKIIPEDSEFSTGLQRSRSSSIQLHLPLMASFSNGANGRGMDETDTLLLRPRNEDISPPLPSPSMSRPFRPNPTLKKRGLVYIFAVIGGCVTFIVLLIVLLSSPTSSANSSIRRQASVLGSSPTKSISRLSSYLGSYLPFLDSYSTAGLSLTSSAILFGHSAPGMHTLHPILPILRSARSRNTNIVSRQSTTLSQAISAYKSRYNRDPPKGFEKWWSFAKARNHTMVDEYDSMMQDILAFSSLSPETLRQRTRTLGQLPGVSMITIEGGKAQIHSKSGKWAPALALQEMMNAFVSTLPDMEIAINEKPEGRVLPGRWKEIKAEDWVDEGFPMEVESELNATDPIAAQIAASGSFKSDWRRDGSVWEAFRRACPPESPARRLVESLRSAEEATNSRQMRLQTTSAAIQQQSDVLFSSSLSRRRAESSGALPRTRELSFNTDVDAAFDLCDRPSVHALHSAFFSDTRSIQHLYPLFSPSKPKGFADLLIPFHQYWSPPSEVTYESDLKKGRTKVPADLDWAQKDDKVFWRGKVSRGAETPAGHFGSFQKPRLVALANDDGSTWSGKEGDPSRHKVKPRVMPHRVLVTLNATSSSLVSMSAPGPKINEYVMDVALACDIALGECAEQERLGYTVKAPGPMSDAWKHKYVLDLDEIGLSPRFPALMESKSAVMKASIQREFWQDWIVPWYHYIPVSSSYAELYNIQSFFSGFPKPFQNRRSTAASSPQKDKEEPAEPIDILADPALLQAKQSGAIIDEDPSSVTLKSEAIQLKPINPAHGATFNGDLALKDIAEQGAAWRREHLRREDMEVYVFRLLLEWSRLVTEPAAGAKSKSK